MTLCFRCDSPQSAQQCGVQRQCDALRMHRRKPIKITLIYEALCPYCQKFISNQLGSIYQQFKDHLELELIPWGNSRILRVS
ncbi:unnamed protein product [Haemonchus placei]|uniref:Thioredoxin-like_fold domain-containing protein n=1 Tax=Haemonchus placei TaxID=6290 RepID=A0A0N4VWA1_HAEPC|nr:unnamed protein product [Haemonchus placei]